MLEQIVPLWDVFIENKQKNIPMVMTTIVETTGNSYKKSGAMILIDANLKTYGLISGGCLESDLAEHSETIFHNRTPKIITYDLSDDSIFGLGAGCDGEIKILMQLIDSQNYYRPFSYLNPEINQAKKSLLALNHNQDSKLFSEYWFQDDEKTLLSVTEIERDKHINPEDYCSIKFKTPLKVAIVGSGIDVIPVCKQVEFMNWHCYILDHREARLKQLPDNKNSDKIITELNNLETIITDFDAVIIMTHNIGRDAKYLSEFYKTNTPYIGLLGPANRRDKVLTKCELKLSDFENRLFAPVGLDLHCNSPEQIALSIVAEIQLKLNNQRTKNS
ncbi:MAG TPA: XdhC family protein [Gammaproteobacteria bacterium]|nr:XdhC family protein [Xanthomonadales bacterium]MCB1595230.1 XdhC family protein [Xanthomonadales bacterium]HOP22309.1 XdhC family protein [Gammaproteobacteria bacterium]HPI94909.1 XdhC family protein [Gammaproteobacteria bacterium]HPQ86502.1 XdhC family protein [Gammaproteobacteria bacterium]